MRRKQSAWRWLERLLFATGVALLSYSGYAWVEARLYQAMENRELDAILAGVPAPERTPVPPEPVPATPSADGEAYEMAPPAESLPTPMRPAAGSAIGRIEIPRLGVSAVIRAGSDARTLRLAVGHIPGTALPGESGNIGLAGHRDTFFRRLRDIRDDDEIRLVTPAGTYAFRVEQTSVVEPTDVWVLDPTSSPTLTLVTCHPFTYVGSAPNRFIVRAVAGGT